MQIIQVGLFGIAALLLFHTFIGYPLLIHFIGKWKRFTDNPATQFELPPLTVVLVVRNEAHRLRSRAQNILDTDYPPEKVELIIVSDASTDHPLAALDSLDDNRIRLIQVEEHRGKPACLNDGIAASQRELIVFADARQRFTRTTLPVLASAFADPHVGAASGELLITPTDSGVASGVDSYWKLEKAIRLAESRIDSAIGCTGAIYAIRRSAYTPLRHDTILDDVVCPMQIAIQGWRVLFVPEAVAFDPQQLEPAREAKRKRRTLAGNFQMLFRHPLWLLPWKNRLAFQLVSHKYLRLIAPFLLIQTLGISASLAIGGSTVFGVLTGAQLAFYLMSAVGYLANQNAPRVFAIPAAFTFLNIMTLRGLIYYISNKRRIGW